MSYFDKYVNLTNAYGTSIQNEYRQDTARKINDSFKDATNYQVGKLNDRDIDLQIVQTPNSMDFETNTFLFRPYEKYSRGDYIDLPQSNTTWILYDSNLLDDLMQRSVVKLCNITLKFLHDGTIKSTPAHFTTLSRTLSADVDYDNKMIIPNTNRTAIIRDDEIAKLIKRNQRFIIGRDAWKVIGIDDVSKKGLCVLTLEFSEIGNNDNIELGIADYHNNIHTYSIEISNGTSSTLEIGKALQLTCLTYDNGVSKQLPVQFTSNDISVATVNDRGIIEGVGNGTCMITASLMDHPSVLDTITITVESVALPDNWSVVIDGVDSIKKTVSSPSTATYTGKVLNNGIHNVTKNVTWEIVSTNETTGFSKIVSQDGVSCVIQAGLNQGKTIVLRATYDSNTYVDKTISIKALF